MWQTDYDPEGVLSTIPAIVSGLIGLIAANIFDSPYRNRIFLIGFCLLGVGFLMHLWIPINKPLWTSSFALVSSGWCALILIVVDKIYALRGSKLVSIFSYIGKNAIVLYVISSLITVLFYKIYILDKNIHNWIYEEIFISFHLSNKAASLLYAIAVMIFYLTLGYVLYRKRIFIKI